MKSKVFLFVMLFIVGRPVSAQKITKASVELRADYVYDGIDGKTIDQKTGFQGTFFNLCFAGKVSEHFGFDIRHRVNKASLDKNFFNGTDKALMYYMPTEQWKFQVGKHSIGVGGFDYDTAPIDLYYTGQYCIDLSCFEWGASIEFALKNQKDVFHLEMVQSPYRYDHSKNNVYGYSLKYTGMHGLVNMIHSINLFETEPGKFLNMIVLGHQINWGNWCLEADFLNKASLNDKGSDYFFKNLSLVGKLKYRPNAHLLLSCKCTYDVNKAEANTLTSYVDYDYLVPSGTECGRVGGIVEYWPLNGKRKDAVRLHALAYWDSGKNTCELGGCIDKQFFMFVGATLRIDFARK
jgi:hypothetical protein